MSLKSFIKCVASELFQQKKIIHISISTASYNKSMQGMRVVVTGGSRGIGYEIAKKLSQEGASVLITSRNENQLKLASETMSVFFYHLIMSVLLAFRLFLMNVKRS